MGDCMSSRTFTLGIAAAALCVGTAVAPAMAADVGGGLYYPPTLPSIENPIYAPTVQAHVDLYAGKAFFSEDDFSQNAGLFGGAGRINVPFRNGWNLQLDAQGSALLLHEDDDSFSFPTEYSGFAHIYRMNPDSHALGVFGGASWFLGPQAYTIGVEGQMYWPHFTLYGQASVAALRVDDESSHAVQLRGQGQWFATDNTAVMGDVIWTHINEFGGSSGVSVLSLAGTLMHRFQGTAFAGFGKVRWDQFAFDGFSGSTTSVLGGVRVMTGQPNATLKQHLREVPMNVEPILFGFPDA